MNRKKIKKILPAILILVCMLIIFIFSSQESEKNNNISLSVTQKVISIMFDNYDIQSEEVQVYVLYSMHVIMRKIAHFILYYILGASIYIAVYSRKNDFRKSFKFSLIIPLIYAASDETHQLFVDGRTARIFDVFIDELGAFSGSLTIFIIISVAYYIRRHKNKLNSIIINL